MQAKFAEIPERPCFLPPDGADGADGADGSAGGRTGAKAPVDCPGWWSMKATEAPRHYSSLTEGWQRKLARTGWSRGQGVQSRSESR